MAGQGREAASLPADAIVLGTIGGLALLILAMLPAPHAGAAGAGLLLVLLIGALVVLGALARQRDQGEFDLVIAGAGALAIVWILISDIALPDGKAILLVGGITAIGSWLAYRRRLADRRRAVAVALEAEIEIKSKFVKRSLTEAVFASMITRTETEDFKPFTFQLDRFLPAYLGHQGEMGLLPPATVMLVVEFYDLEEALTRLYNGIGEKGFHELPNARRIALYREFQRMVVEEYHPAADRVLAALRAIKSE